MSTLVCFHAHPDDEALSTGGLMAKAARDGHRVVLVCATRGEQGEPKPGVLEDGESLRDRRVNELARSCEILGADAPRFLDYEDSGMIGEPSNDSPACFWQADIEEAASRLEAILREVDASVLTIYDAHGLYGHPDHIQVHRVGLAAATRIGDSLKVYESTVNRDVALASFERLSEAGEEGPSLEEMHEFGVPQKDLVYSMDITEYIDVKRESMRAHASQISEEDFFLTIPNEAFGHMFGTEWFAEPGRTDTGGPVPVDLLPGL
jgi:LmbE family N-acetylglucosaminyl deacetylase